VTGGLGGGRLGSRRLASRVVDPGAIAAAWVGVGMALTIGVSFLLVIPIEPIFWYLILPAGVLIGYYANQRSDRRAGPWRRIVANALLAGAATGLTAALLLLGVKALFFAADDGYRDEGLGGRLECSTGADCVYQRYIDAGRGDELVELGVTDADSFAAFYWQQQLTTAGVLFLAATAGSLGGGLLYGVFRPKVRAGPGAAATATR
jgi:hypothetical protein